MRRMFGTNDSQYTLKLCATIIHFQIFDGFRICRHRSTFQLHHLHTQICYLLLFLFRFSTSPLCPSSIRQSTRLDNDFGNPLPQVVPTQLFWEHPNARRRSCKVRLHREAEGEGEDRVRDEMGWAGGGLIHRGAIVGRRCCWGQGERSSPGFTPVQMLTRTRGFVTALLTSILSFPLQSSTRTDHALTPLQFMDPHVVTSPLIDPTCFFLSSHTHA